MSQSQSANGASSPPPSREISASPEPSTSRDMPPSDDARSESPLDQRSATSFNAALRSAALWSSTNALGQFRNRGIEAAFVQYAGSVWALGVPRWVGFAAACFSFAPVFALVNTVVDSSLLARGLSPTPRWAGHPTIYIFQTALACVFWLAFGCLRAYPKFLERRSHLAQRFIGCLALATVLAGTLPVLLQPPAQLAASLDVDDANEYIDGRWHMLVAAAGGALLACSGASPPLFLSICGLAFPLWTARNQALRLAWNSLPADSATPCLPYASAVAGSDVSSLVWDSIGNHLALVLICFLVNLNREKMVRQNFVILQLVTGDKDKQISALTGEKQRLEKQRLELVATVERAQANARQHIKFVAEGMASPGRRLPRPTPVCPPRHKPKRAAAAAEAAPRAGAFGGCTAATTDAGAGTGTSPSCARASTRVAPMLLDASCAPHRETAAQSAAYGVEHPGRLPRTTRGRSAESSGVAAVAPAERVALAEPVAQIVETCVENTTVESVASPSSLPGVPKPPAPRSTTAPPFVEGARPFSSRFAFRLPTSHRNTVDSTATSMRELEKLEA